MCGSERASTLGCGFLALHFRPVKLTIACVAAASRDHSAEQADHRLHVLDRRVPVRGRGAERERAHPCDCAHRPVRHTGHLAAVPPPRHPFPLWFGASSKAAPRERPHAGSCQSFFLVRMFFLIFWGFLLFFCPCPSCPSRPFLLVPSCPGSEARSLTCSTAPPLLFAGAPLPRSSKACAAQCCPCCF